MSENDRDFEAPVETTSVFREEFINELDAGTSTSSEPAETGVERLAPGTALLVVKRGGPTRDRGSSSTSRRPQRVGIPTATSSSTM